MRVEDVMDTAVEAARADTPAELAWNRMRHRGTEMFAITDESGIVGLVTRRQLGGRAGSLNRRDRTLGDFACTRSVTTTPEGEVAHVAEVLSGRLAGCVPVLRRGQLVGVVTIAGLLARLAQNARHQRPTHRPARDGDQDSALHARGRRPADSVRRHRSARSDQEASDAPE